MNSKLKSNWAGTIAFLLILFTAIFLYFDRGNEISNLIKAWGPLGIVFAVFLMTALFMTPVPSEGLTVLYLKIYGVYFGTFYSWIGSVLSAIAFFYLARTYGQKFMKLVITKERFETVDNWIQKKGTLGLLIARFLPIPSFFVNCIAGIMSNVKFWPFVWTASVAIIPYFVGIALIFEGTISKTHKWIILGIVIEIACILSGLLLMRKKDKQNKHKEE